MMKETGWVISQPLNWCDTRMQIPPSLMSTAFMISMIPEPLISTRTGASDAGVTRRLPRLLFDPAFVVLFMSSMWPGVIGTRKEQKYQSRLTAIAQSTIRHEYKKFSNRNVCNRYRNNPRE